MLSMDSRKKLYDMLIADEAYRQYPYKCTAGKLTIGIGRNLEDRGVSMDEAMYMLQNDVKNAVAELLKAFPWVMHLDDNRKMVIISMVFNMGMPTFSQFKKMLAALQDKNYALAAKEMLDSKWAREDVPARAQRLAYLMERG